MKKRKPSNPKRRNIKESHPYKQAPYKNLFNQAHDYWARLHYYERLEIKKEALLMKDIRNKMRAEVGLGPID